MKNSKRILFFAIAAYLITGVIPSAAAFEFTPDLLTVPSGIPLSELEQFIDEYAAEHIGIKTAGASVAVIKNGELIFHKAYGYAVQDEKEATTDSVFEWGSATKLLIWTSVMQLVEQGKLDLNRDIREYLPENFLKKLKYETPITVYNLMHHNAGWEDRVVDLFYRNPNTVPDLEGALLAFEPAQIYRPGTIVAYSNFGTAIAGFIVQRVTGKPFHEYVWENIFEPLGMKETSIHPLQADNSAIAERRALIKGHVPGTGKPAVFRAERAFIGLYPAGSVIGTTGDAAKFLAALMPADGENSVLFNDRNTLDKMLTPSLLFREGLPRFAHGFMEYFSTVRALGHGGNTVAFSSLFTVAPEERFGLVVMTNQAGETAMCMGLTRALFGEFAPPEHSGDFPDTGNFAGEYTMARVPKNGFTKLFITASMIIPVKPVDENTLDIGGSTFIQISPYLFKNTGGNEILDIFEYVFFETENGNVTRVSINYFDFLPASTGKVVLIYLSLILFVLCILYILAAVIITIIGAVKNKKKGVRFNLAKKLNIIIYCSMSAAIINNVILAFRGLSFEVYASLTVHFIINIVYMIFIPLCIGFMLANIKKEKSKASIVFNIFSMASSLIFAVLLLTWQFWR